MTAKKSGKGHPDWAYWTKLKEVKVFEALALLDAQEPPEDCPDPDEEGSVYRRRMRLLLDALPNREWFSPHSLNIGNSLLFGVSLPEVGRWAKENGINLPGGFPVAPPRIAWEFWKARRTVKLWEACLLSLGLDPERVRFSANGWMAGIEADPIFEADTFPNAATEQAYRRRLILLKDHRTNAQHFTPLSLSGRMLSGAEQPVELPEFCTWAKAMALVPLTWELEQLATAPPLRSMGIKPSPANLAVMNDKVTEDKQATAAGRPSVPATPTPAQSPSASQSWQVNPPKRMDSLAAAIHRTLTAERQAGHRRPTATELLELWRNKKPDCVVRLRVDGVDWTDGDDRDDQTADRRALQDRILRMTK